jgi:hypothetical protein
VLRTSDPDTVRLAACGIVSHKLLQDALKFNRNYTGLTVSKSTKITVSKFLSKCGHTHWIEVCRRDHNVPLDDSTSDRDNQMTRLDRGSSEKTLSAEELKKLIPTFCDVCRDRMVFHCCCSHSDRSIQLSDIALNHYILAKQGFTKIL